MADLFSSIKIGDIITKNRIFMAPLTRARVERDAVPVPMMAEYYAQRAQAGLIISEATGISREGLGWPYAPGIWTDEQVEAWKSVTQAVHDKGGKIVCQLWHMGRAVHSSVTGLQPVSASETTAPDEVHTYDGKKPYEKARALTKSDITRILNDYEQAARNAMRAGFDGVQIHAANGYLIDQFLRDGTNHRSDEYGGSLENRVRLLVEVTQRVIATVGAEKTGVRLSPNGDSQGVIDSAPEKIFVLAAQELERLGVAWLELRENSTTGTFLAPTDQPKLSPEIRKVFHRSLVLNQDYSFEEAQAAIRDGHADAIAFGRKFISNPDLPDRFAKNIPLQESNVSTWYSRGEEGYIDYPFAK
ncbi:alkene reductase [Swingsia samuiensis]|uniref:Alkene reductase n=1 Tax=Swingsia samuiensis TaxID=1293412 RepID=A0A4Y6UKP1_9PROT|nr:alkene reductase [Swingsia samuiensis]QDH17370.1 alkene reductase [Swingsia samuiensis]